MNWGADSGVRPGGITVAGDPVAEVDQVVVTGTRGDDADGAAKPSSAAFSVCVRPSEP